MVGEDEKASKNIGQLRAFMCRARRAPGPSWAAACAAGQLPAAMASAREAEAGAGARCACLPSTDRPRAQGVDPQW